MKAKSKPAKKAPPAVSSERREGYKAAIRMLRQLEASTELCDASALDKMIEKRPKPQHNVVHHCLQRCREHSPDTEAAFCAVLSDFVADCSEGFVPNSRTYQKALKIRVPAGTVSKETERLRTWKAIKRLTGDAGPMPSDWMK
jgi:hypothetical protein